MAILLLHCEGRSRGCRWSRKTRLEGGSLPGRCCRLSWPPVWSSCSSSYASLTSCSKPALPSASPSVVVYSFLFLGENKWLFSHLLGFFYLQFRAGCLRWRIGHAFLGSGDPSEVSEKHIIAILLCRLNNSKKKKITIELLNLMTPWWWRWEKVEVFLIVCHAWFCLVVDHVHAFLFHCLFAGIVRLF